MFIVGNLLVAVGKILDLLISVAYLVFIGRAVISWMQVDNQYTDMLKKVSDPLLVPIRRYMPPTGMVDYSPMVALLILYFTDIFVVASLLEIGSRLK